VRRGLLLPMLTMHSYQVDSISARPWFSMVLEFSMHNLILNVFYKCHICIIGAFKCGPIQAGYDAFERKFVPWWKAQNWQYRRLKSQKAVHAMLIPRASLKKYRECEQRCWSYIQRHVKFRREYIMRTAKQLEQQLSGLLTVKDICAMFDITDMTVAAWRRKRGMPTLVIGGGKKQTLRFIPEEIQAWARQHNITMIRYPGSMKSPHRVKRFILKAA
jgi:hypothetical protein